MIYSGGYCPLSEDETLAILSFFTVHLEFRYGESRSPVAEDERAKGYLGNLFTVSGNVPHPSNPKSLLQWMDARCQQLWTVGTGLTRDGWFKKTLLFSSSVVLITRFSVA